MQYWGITLSDDLGERERLFIAGLNVNDQLVAYLTRFSAVRLKNHVWSHHRALKAKVQCDLSSAYSLDRSIKVLRLINIIDIRYNITRHKIRKSHHFLCVLFVIFKPTFPLDSLDSNVIFLHGLWCKQLCWHMQINKWSTCSLCNRL